MVQTQADSVTEELQNILSTLRKELYLTDNTGKKIAGFQAMGSWLIQIYYEDNSATILHCTQVFIEAKKV